MSALISEIVETNRLRHDFVLAQGNLDRQIKKIVARVLGQKTSTDAEVCAYHASAPAAGREHLGALIELRDAAKTTRNRYDLRLRKLAEALPVYREFAEPINGFGALGLAQIVGEAGAALFPNYAKPAKLVRRFGLHVHEGKSFSTWRRTGGLSKQAWSNAGYNPRRRSVIWAITDSLLKKQNRYKALCDERKAIYRRKAEAAGLTVLPQRDIPKDSAEKFRSAGHIKALAERYVSKRLLLDLWRAWRDQLSLDSHTTYVPSPAEFPAAQEAA